MTADLAGLVAADGTAEDGSPLERRAFPFMPAEPDRHGVAVETGAGWDRAVPADAAERLDVVVWGRLPDASRSLLDALRSAVAREVALRRLSARPPAPFRVVGIHRLMPGGLGGGGRGRVRAALRAGALVELTTLAPGARVLDAALRAADARLDGRIAFGSGGTLIARVTLGGAEQPSRGAAGALLRLAASGAPGDPARTSDTLEMLARLGVPLAPRPLARGTTAGASWTVESALPGRRPARLTPELARRVAAALAAFPRTDGPPGALEADLGGILARVPSRAERTGRLLAAIAAELATGPT
ncbi:MAG: hypothetical protein QOF11_959, partial [Chloroflexota bacterium]|nr:hypothetical protein [Chloroflexota bacterium]